MITGIPFQPKGCVSGFAVLFRASERQSVMAL